MPKASFTTWADTTEQTVLAAACRVTRVDIYPHASQAAEVYLHFWDAANPTPGVTASKMQLPCGTIATSGRRKRTFLFPGGGVRFGTACTAFLATASAGATAPTTTSLCPRVDVWYVVGN